MSQHFLNVLPAVLFILAAAGASIAFVALLQFFAFKLRQRDAMARELTWAERASRSFAFHGMRDRGAP